MKANDGYDRQADNQYDENGYDHTDGQNDRYGHDHQADNQYVNGYDHAYYQYSGNDGNHTADDQYGGRRSDQGDKKGYAVSRRIRSNERHHFYSNYSYICRNTSVEIIRTALTHRSQNKTNSLEGMFECLNECGMNAYNAGVIHCDHIPYNACFTGIYCIIPLFLLFR